MSGARTGLAGVVAAAGDLLLGAVCPGCGAPGLGLCPECRALLTFLIPGRHRPEPSPPGFPLTYAVGAYADPLRSMIIAHKEEQALLLAPTLGRLLAAAAAELVATTGAGDQPLELVPMPSAGAAVRRRGYDAVGTMTAHAARRLRRHGLDVRAVHRLAQRRGVRDQAGLGAEQRRANLAGRLRVRSRTDPQRAAWLVLVDDVVTTGATLSEASRTLHSAGFRVLGAATVAATQRVATGRRS